MSVTVQVAHVGAGVWARFTGLLSDGSPVTVSGAVAGGPDPVEGGAWAVAVRDFKSGRDVVLYMAGDAVAELVDDRADAAARAAHAVDAIVPATALRVDWLRWVPVKPGSERGQWVDGGSLHNVPYDQLAQWEAGNSDPDLMLSAVHFGHLPIEDGAL